ncbi:MAG: hypothetical protein OER93_04580 [Thermoleophilia bacterium]|nr:hypothetical protein [Thermoleophilia bacterium]
MATTAISHGRQIQKSRLAAMIATLPYLHLLAFGALVLKGAIDVSGLPSSEGPDPTALGALYSLAVITFPLAIASGPVLAAVAVLSPMRRDLWLRRAITAGIGLIAVLAVMTVDPGGLWTWSGLPG